ncbi:hypothetical protein J6590_001692 [Homalodisca vitripennis]|nr:hypothetical protein J6590_001692 [Homalodisca vitripennis]
MGGVMSLFTTTLGQTLQYLCRSGRLTRLLKKVYLNSLNTKHAVVGATEDNTPLPSPRHQHSLVRALGFGSGVNRAGIPTAPSFYIYLLMLEISNSILTSKQSSKLELIKLLTYLGEIHQSGRVTHERERDSMESTGQTLLKALRVRVWGGESSVIAASLSVRELFSRGVPAVIP